MRILVAYSSCPVTVVFLRSMGHEAFTCDLLPSRLPFQDWHIKGDVWDHVDDGWDIGIFHPMCTYLTVSAAWAFKEGPYHQPVKPGTLVGAARRQARAEAIDNFARLLELPFPLAIENPSRSFVNTAIRPPDQVIQPYEYGDDAKKSTGLWLKDLPPLRPTERVKGRMVNGIERFSNQTDSGQDRTPAVKHKWLKRSQTFPGIAKAMALQWGAL